MTGKTTNMRVPEDLYNRVSDVDFKEDISTPEKARRLIEIGLEMLDFKIDFDENTKHRYFQHQAAKKGETYKKDLKKLALTEKELIDLALEKSGLSYSELIKQGVLIRAKELLTMEARKEHLESKGIPTIETRIQQAIEQLENDLRAGTYKPRAGRIPIARIAGLSGANYATVKKWVQDNRPDLMP